MKTMILKPSLTYITDCIYMPIFGDAFCYPVKIVYFGYEFEDVYQFIG